MVNTQPLLSVVIPVYRSESIVARLCEELARSLSDIEHEILLVDDDSPDRSWREIEKAAASDPHIRGIGLRRNSGQDRAIMAGLRFSSGDYVVVMDDDLQHRPADILPLLEKIKEGHDVVYANFFRKRQSAFKNLMSWGAGKVAEYVLNKPRDIYMSPFKIMRRDVVDQILRYQGPFPYVDGLIFQITSRIDKIIVTHHARLEGGTTHTFWKQLGLFLTLATSFSILPLRIVTVAGFCCAGISFLLGAYFLLVYFIKGAVVVGWTALALINLFVGGIVMISLGVIGEYIGRVLISVNQAPQFVVGRTVNIDRHSVQR